MRVAARSALAGVLVVALATSVTGCDWREDEPRRLPEIGPTWLPDDIEKVAYPLDEFLLEEESSQIEHAWAVAASACLERFGIDVPPGAAVPMRRLTAENRYGMVSKQKAVEFGYRSVTPPAAEPFLHRVPAEALPIFAGTVSVDGKGQAVPEGGCRGEATRQIIPQGNPSYVSELAKTASERAAKDERLLALVQKWSECMDKAGYRFSFPNEPYLTWVARAKPGSTVDQIEAATAIADVDCKVRTGLLGLWIAVEIAHQRKVIDENAEKLRQHQKAMAAAAANAARFARIQPTEALRR